jgi:hypothetical protein
MFLRLAVGVFVLAVALGVPRAAQPQGAAVDRAATQGGLVGRVTDEHGAPVPDADVRVGGVTSIARTGADGWFRVPDAALGLLWFGVRKIGYRPVADLIRLSPGDTVDVVIERIGPELDTVKVQARADAFYERELRRFTQAVEAARFGRVVTADEIARRQPVLTSDLFQAMVGFRVIGSGGAAQVVGRGNCTPFIVIDGIPEPAVRVNDVLPQSIRLLITFSSFAQLPATFQFPTARRDCGAIVIYTI